MKYLLKNECTACGACQNMCPTNSIDMINDENDGFIYPIINKKTCIKCNKCISVCPIINKLSYDHRYKLKTYAAWSLDDETRINSTSGGIFTELTKFVLSKEGYVVGARYNKEHLVEHYIISDTSEIELLRQSKYVQSKIGMIFKNIKEILDQDKFVMFVGTPCQGAGLKKFLNKEYDKLIVCDFICRGVNSPKAYIKYLEYLEQEYDSKVIKVWFKNKINGWNNFCTKIEFENGKEYYSDRYNDLFMKGYLKYNLFMRMSCSNCNFKGFPRISDITLADFWGIQLEDKDVDIEKGTSLVVINSEKGHFYFQNIKRNLFCIEKNINDAIPFNRCALDSIKSGIYRKYFFDKLKDNNFRDLILDIDKKKEGDNIV